MSEQPKPATPRWKKFLLVGSLALNIAILGLIAGLALRGPTGAARPSNLPSHGLIAMHQALPDGPRREIRREFFSRRGEMGEMRRKSETLRSALPELLTSDPLDIDALRENLKAQELILSDFSDRALEVLVAGIQSMTLEERAEFATNLRAPRKPRRHPGNRTTQPAGQTNQ